MYQMRVYRVKVEGHDWSHLRLCANSDLKKALTSRCNLQVRWRRPLMLLMYDVKQL